MPLDLSVPTVDLDEQIWALQSGLAAWKAVSAEDRAVLMEEVAAAAARVAKGWAQRSARGKGIPAGSHLEGEEWLIGPYALIKYCKTFAQRLRDISDGKLTDGIPLRQLDNKQIAARIFPRSGLDRALQAGLFVDVWMEPGVTADNIDQNIGAVFRDRPDPRICVVLGAGNVSAIAPLDCIYKLFFANELCLLKLNPVNGYLRPYLEAALRPLIDRNLLAIVEGDAATGDYLCTHRDVDSLFITGSQAAHDAIVWGSGDEADRNRAEGTPRNARPIESELGGVGPTIVVPGPWSASDIAYHAAHIATQKLENEGHMCVACQVLVLPGDWAQSDDLLAAVTAAMKDVPHRPAYYPGAQTRAETFTEKGRRPQVIENSIRAVVQFEAGTDPFFEQTEVFGPVLSSTRLPSPSAATFLESAIDYANSRLYGTLAANIIIHPKTVKEIGSARFEALLTKLRYGTIAINTWSGIAFTMPEAPWGAFPGHPLDNVQSGIGKVHNAMMFDRPERTVIHAPFRQRPIPPWFANHRSALKAAEALTKFESTRSVLHLAKLVLASMRP